MNMNILFDVLTSFKIKFTKHPDPTQVSNMKLKFVKEQTGIKNTIKKEYNMKGIQLSEDEKEVEIVLSEA